MLWLPLLATVLYTISLAQRKLFLRATRLPIAEFFPALLFVLALTAAALLPFGGATVDLHLVFEPFYLVAALLLVLLGTLWHELLYRGLREEQLSRFDLLMVCEPLVVIFGVALVVPAERDPRIFLGALVACLALAWGHRNHHRITFERGERLLLGAIGVSVLVVLLERYLLVAYSPIALNALYAVGIWLAFIVRYGLVLPSRALWPGFLMTAVGIAANSVLFFYSYRIYGVTLTTLIMMLQPVGLAAIAFFYLKEPIRPKLLAAGIVVLITILATLLIVQPS